MIDRVYVEAQGKRGSGVIDSVGDYHWVRVLNEFEMYVHQNDKSVSPHLVRDGYWESWITAWLKNHIDKNTFFLDIGANTGYYAFIADSRGAVTLAFEPNRVYADMIRATLMRRVSNVVLTETALSDYWGEAVLNIPTELHGSASLSEIPGYETTKQEVHVRPLDEILTESAYDKTIMKIDAEGEEEKILRGARNFIEKTENLVILMEYTPGAYSQYFLADLFHDYEVAWINHAGYEGPVTPEGLLRQTDWLMLTLRPKKKSGTMAQRG